MIVRSNNFNFIDKLLYNYLLKRTAKLRTNAYKKRKKIPMYRYMYMQIQKTLKNAFKFPM